MTREEHLQLAKDRALALLDSGDTSGAFTSLLRDLADHPELVDVHNDSALVVRGMTLAKTPRFDDPEVQAEAVKSRAEGMRAWITEH